MLTHFGRRTKLRMRSAPVALVLTIFFVINGFGAPAVAERVQSPHASPASSFVPARLGPFGPPNDNWTTYMGNVEHTSDAAISPSLNTSSASRLVQQWAFDAHGSIVGEPIVANNRVYVGSWDGDEYALNASNGTMRWGTYTGQSECQPGTRYAGVSSTPTLTTTGLYFGGGADYWEALSPSNGSILWQVHSGNSNYTKGNGSYNWASALVYNGFLYIGLSSHCSNPDVEGALLKVSLKTHAVVAHFNFTKPRVLGAGVWSTPALDPATGVLYIATGSMYVRAAGNNTTLDDSIVALNATTMRYIDHFQVPYSLRVANGDFGASPTLFRSQNGTPLVGADNKDGIFFALNRSNLSRGALWADNISEVPINSPAAFAFGNLYVGSARTTIWN